MQELFGLAIVTLLVTSCSLSQLELASNKSTGEDATGVQLDLYGAWTSPCSAGQSGFLRVNQDQIQTTIRLYKDDGCTVPDVQFDFVGIHEIGEALPSPPYPAGAVAFTWQNSYGYVMPRSAEAVARLNGVGNPESKLCDQSVKFELNQLKLIRASVCMGSGGFLDNFTVRHAFVQTDGKGGLIFGEPGDTATERPSVAARVFFQPASVPVGGSNIDGSNGGGVTGNSAGATNSSTTKQEAQWPVIVQRPGRQTPPDVSPLPEPVDRTIIDPLQ